MQLKKADLTRVLLDLLSAERQIQHGKSSNLCPLTLNDSLAELSPAVDSMTRLQLAATINQFFQLHKSGLEDNLLRSPHLSDWLAVLLQAQPFDSLCFRTSGSLGKPKHCLHSLATLWQETEVLAALFSGRQRLISLIPSHHIYGFLFTVLLPEALNCPLLDGRSQHPVLKSGDLLIAVPAQWQYLHHSLATWPENVYGVTSTAPCDADLISDLRKQGLARMTEVYGSSETAGIGYRHDPGAAYTLFDYWVPQTENDSLQRRCPTGTLMTPVTAADALHWVSERTFKPCGRRDDVVQVGGINVSLQAVAGKLRQHPAVADCAVRLMSGKGIADARLKAFIVLQAGESADLLHEWLADNFLAPERPVHLTFGTALPRNVMGKLCDWQTL